MAPHVAHVVAERRQQLADDLLRPAAELALEVAVLDERYARVLRSADMVARRVDLLSQIEEVLGRL